VTQTQTITRIQEIIARLQEALPLLIEEQQGLPPGPLTIAEVEARHQRREQISGLIQEAYTRLRSLPYGEGWPSLPKPEWMAWAQAVLAQPGSLILEVDTSGLQVGAEVLRLLLLRLEDGAVVFDQCIRPTQSLAERPEALTYNGLTAEELAGAPPLEEVWPAFWQQARGKVLVSFNWPWDYQQLTAACRRLGQGVPALLGLDLQEPACTYFGLSFGFASLGDICCRLGEPLSRPATALERARGQLAILRAMAEGRLGPLHEQEEVDEGDLEALDDLDDTQPF
jgi:DNA polymerase III epsilon subunit-like protein